MKTLNFVASTLLLLGVSLVGCSMGSGKVTNGKDSDATVKKTVKIGNFTKIDASNGIKVIYTEGSSTGVAKISTTPNGEKYLKVYVSNGELKCYYDTRGVTNANVKGPTIVTVQSPQLTEIDLSSAASVQVPGAITTPRKLSIDLSSAAKVSINTLSTTELDVEMSSAAAVKINYATVNDIEAELSSAAKLTVDKVEATKLDVETSSSAKCEINSFNGSTIEAEASSAGGVKIANISAVSIKAEASSGGSITLAGNCSYLSKDKSSGGSVNTNNLTVNGNSAGTVKKGAPRVP